MILRQTVALIATVALTASCSPRVRPPQRPPAAGPDTVLAALAARERAMNGARVSMRVQSSGSSAPAALDSPAYLAVESPGHLRLQVLSIIGVTVLHLAIDDQEYVLSLPLRGETHRGHLDPALLGAASGTPGERMIVALALLFQPRFSRERCRIMATEEAQGRSQATAAAGVVCQVASTLVATTLVDANLQPVRETFANTDGAIQLLVEYDRYETTEWTAFPGRITMRDPASQATMIVRVVRVRRNTPSAAL